MRAGEVRVKVRKADGRALIVGAGCIFDTRPRWKAQPTCSVASTSERRPRLKTHRPRMATRYGSSRLCDLEVRIVGCARCCLLGKWLRIRAGGSQRRAPEPRRFAKAHHVSVNQLSHLGWVVSACLTLRPHLGSSVYPQARNDEN